MEWMRWERMNEMRGEERLCESRQVEKNVIVSPGGQRRWKESRALVHGRTDHKVIVL